MHFRTRDCRPWGTHHRAPTHTIHHSDDTHHRHHTTADYSRTTRWSIDRVTGRPSREHYRSDSVSRLIRSDLLGGALDCAAACRGDAVCAVQYRHPTRSIGCVSRVGVYSDASSHHSSSRQYSLLAKLQQATTVVCW